MASLKLALLVGGSADFAAIANFSPNWHRRPEGDVSISKQSGDVVCITKDLLADPPALWDEQRARLM